MTSCSRSSESRRSSGAAQATLIDRGGGLIYDSVLNVTWLQNANLASNILEADIDQILDGFGT